MTTRAKFPPKVAEERIARLRRRKGVMDGVREGIESEKQGRGVRFSELKRKRG